MKYVKVAVLVVYDVAGMLRNEGRLNSASNSCQIWSTFFVKKCEKLSVYILLVLLICYTLPWLPFCFSACFSAATVCFAQSFQSYGHYSREDGHISTLSVLTTEKLFCIPAAILRCYSCHGYHCHDDSISI